MRVFRASQSLPEGVYKVTFQAAEIQEKPSLLANLFSSISDAAGLAVSPLRRRFPFAIGVAERVALLATRAFFSLIGSTPKVLTTVDCDVAKGLLAHPRHDPEGRRGGLFMVPVQPTPLLGALYPEETIGNNDAIFTCDAGKLHDYRGAILRAIGAPAIRKSTEALGTCIEKLSKELIGPSDTPQIDAAELAVTYSTALLGRAVFGQQQSLESYSELGKALSLLRSGPQTSDLPPLPNGGILSLLSFALQVIRISAEKRTPAIDAVRAAVDAALSDAAEPIVGSLVAELRQDAKLTDLQIKGTIATLYVAGLDTTSSLLVRLLAHLSQNQALQETIFDEIAQDKPLLEAAESSLALSSLFTKISKRDVPVEAIDRTAAQGLICTATNTEGQEVFRESIPRGSQIIYECHFPPRNETAPSFPFGAGVHVCPGQHLAKAELLGFLAFLVKHYRIDPIGPLTDTDVPVRRRQGFDIVDGKLPLSLTRR